MYKILPRQKAYEIIYLCLYEGGYSNQLLQHTDMEKESDQNLLTQLVYGVLQHFLRYEQEMIAWNTGKNMSKKAKVIGALTLYQTEYLTRIPAYAVRAEALKLSQAYAKKEKAKIDALSQYFNRELLIEKKQAATQTFEQVDDQSFSTMSKKERAYIFEKLSYVMSFPLWIVKLIYGQSKQLSTTKAYLAYHNQKPEIYLRVRDQYLAACRDLYRLDGTAYVVESGSPLKHPLIIEKQAVVQDFASQQLRYFLPEKTPNHVLDMCAAPGGKTFLVADFYKDAHITANDMYIHKVEKMIEAGNALNIEHIEYVCHDALTLTDVYPERTFDLIILDAPCSGLGVIRRRPEMRYRLNPDDLDTLQAIQTALLECAHRLLTDDGILIYSTCTVNKKENDAHFFNNEVWTLVDAPFSTYGFNTKSDGFYIQKLKKGR